MKLRTLLAFCFCLAALPVSAQSYTATTVTNGGSVKGTINYKGKPVAAKTTTISKDTAVCGSSAKEESIVVSAKGTLANVVVYLSDITKGEAATAQSPVLDQKGCVYTPHVQATTAGSSLQILNSDGVFHNVHVYNDAGKGSTLFNLAMPLKGQKISKKLSKAGILGIKCDAGHTWMQSFIHVFSHPYFAVSKADGTFEIAKIPAGTYTLVAWHETLGELKQKVTITASGTSTLTIDFK